MSTSSQLPDQPPTTEDFLRRVLRSGLIGRDELQAALRGVPRDRRDSPGLANHLVRKGKLTRYQANKILGGVSQGLILGPFRILAPLGKGGMATVFLARDDRSGHLVALKVLPPRVARSEERMVARFRREMSISQKVSHDHLAWTYESGEHRGVFYIAMEYIPGKTLAKLVADEGPLPVPRAARLMAEVASGLHHAHEQGLVHRDLKPSNIIVTPRDHAKIVDLGLALVGGETGGDARIVGGQGFIVGTMDYIAPEQTLDAAAVGPRADIYSLGCTLYFALTGQPPFPGGTAKEKIHHHRLGDLPSLHDRVPDLPPGFVALVERFVARDPADRPESAEEAERLLRGWAASESELGPESADETLDESAIIRLIPDAADGTHVSLPELDPGTDDSIHLEPLGPEPPAVPYWVWVVAALGLAVAGVMVMLAVMRR